MKKLISLAVLAIPLALPGCGSKSPATSGTAASKTSSKDAAQVNAA